MLADEIAAALPELRREAEALMGCTFEVHSPNGLAVVGGLKVQQYAAEASTPGKVQGGSASTQDTAIRTRTIGGVTYSVLVAGLHIPVGAPVPAAGERGTGWEYHCTAVTDPADAALVGRWYLVVSAPAKTYATARRLDVVEVPVPEALA